MNIEELHQYFLSKKGCEECFPFDEETLVFKVMGKMFGLIPLERRPHQCNLKCDPEYAEELRATYAGIIPGYHMSKKHWNSVFIEEDVEDQLILSLVDHSYELVVASLTKKLKEELKNL
jgi:predicted DNA-binding protein (MmcQ/YjbR family)